MKIFGGLVILGGIGLLAVGHVYVGVAALVIGILMVLLNSKMSET